MDGKKCNQKGDKITVDMGRLYSISLRKEGERKEENMWRQKIYFCGEEGKGENYFFAEENNNGVGTV